MAFTYGFYDSLNGDRRYKATDFNELVGSLLTDGIFENIGQKMMVTVGSGMQINVGSGKAWFDDTWSVNDSTMVLTVPQSDITRPRYDAVVLEVNQELTVRENSIKIISGTPAVTPVKPSLTNTTKVHQHPLAYILVPAAATAITASNIEVVVGRTECPFVTGILQKTDITDLYNQWNADFQTWFNNLKDQLTSNVVTNLQAQIDSLSSRVTEAASVAEVTAGTVANKYVSPATLKSVYGNAKDTVLDTRTNQLVHVRSELSELTVANDAFWFAFMNNDSANPGYSLWYNQYGTSTSSDAGKTSCCGIVYHSPTKTMIMCVLRYTNGSVSAMEIRSGTVTSFASPIYLISGFSNKLTLSMTSNAYNKGFNGYAQTVASINSDLLLGEYRSADTSSQWYYFLVDIASSKYYGISTVFGTNSCLGAYKTANYWGFILYNRTSSILYYGRTGANPTSTLTIASTATYVVGVYDNILWLSAQKNSTTKSYTLYKVDFSSGSPSVTQTSTSVTRSDPILIDGRYAYFPVWPSTDTSLTNTNIYAKPAVLDMSTGTYSTTGVTTSGTLDIGDYFSRSSTNRVFYYYGTIGKYSYFYATGKLLRFDHDTTTFSLGSTRSTLGYPSYGNLTGKQKVTVNFPHIGNAFVYGDSILYPESGQIYSILTGTYTYRYFVAQIGNTLTSDFVLALTRGSGNWNDSDAYQKYTAYSGETATFTALVDY